MSKQSRQSPSPVNIIYAWLYRNVFLLAVVGLVFTLRLPFLFEPLNPGKEAVYLTFAQNLAPNPPSFTFLEQGLVSFVSLALHLFGTSVWSIKFATTLWLSANLGFVYWQAKRFFGDKQALFLTIFLSLAFSLPFWGANQLSVFLFYLPILINLLLLVTPLLKQKGNLWSKYLSQIVWALGLLFIFVNFSVTTTKSGPDYYSNFAKYTFGKISGAKQADEVYLKTFGSKAFAGQTLAGFLISKTKPTANIFQFGDLSNLYSLSQRRSSASYLTTKAIIAHQEETLSQLAEQIPAFIIVSQDFPSFEQLDRLLRRGYNRLAQTENVTVYQLKNN